MSQIFVPGVHNLQVTIGAGTTQFSTDDIAVRWMAVQNNAAHNVRVGDGTTTASIGILLLTNSGGGGGSISTGQTTNLNQWYVAGTQNDVLDVLYIQA